MCVNHNLFAMILPTKFIILGGKKLNKKNITLRIAAITVCTATLLSNTNLSVFAESELTVSHFSYQNYDITYSLTNHWDDKYQGNIIIKNTSDDIIHDWCIAFLSDNNIDYAWNGIVEKYENLTFIHNNTYNQDILPGDTIEVGFIESAGEINIPSKYELISEPTVASTEDYTTEFKVVNDWETGYTATFTITNTSDETLEDWSLEFDWDNNIDTIWNAEIAAHNEYHYVINNASYNQNITPGSSITISFQNNNSGNVETKPGNITLSEYGYVRREAINTLLNVRDVSLDLSAFEYNDEGYYLVEDEISSLSGIIRPGLLAVSGNYSIENAWGTVLAEGEFAPESNWCINDIGFVLGMNKVTVDVKFSDDSVSTVTAWFMNYNENNMKNIAIDNDDTDGDGLSNYLESIYGTDPLLPDTDGDELTDYQEIAEYGTNPLIVDTDNDGILDGRDDFDEDGIDSITEYALGTDPFCIDTDGDGLNDYDELYVYATSPLLADTDSDSADDKWEIDNGYDPLTKDAFFETTKTIVGSGNSAEISVTGYDGSVSTVEATVVDNSTFINSSIPGYMGSAFDFTMDGEFSSAEIKITFDEEYLSDENFVPTIYYFNEKTQELEEIETEWDGKSNFVIAKLTHFSTYVLLNKVKFDQVFKDIEIASNLTDATYEFVFAIDCSGSMGPKGSNNDPQNIRLKVAKEFVDKLDEDDKGAVLSFGSGTTVLCEFTNDKTELKNAINKVGNTDGDTYIGEAVDKSISLFSEPNGSARYIILLTDGCPTDSMSADYASKAVSKDIKIITVGLGSGVDAKFLQQITNATFPNNEGLYYFASVAGELDVVYDKIKDDIKHEDPYLDSNNDGITDEQTRAFCEGRLQTKFGTNPFEGYTFEFIQNDKDGDLDNDGLKNGEELDISKYDRNSSQIGMNSDPIKYDSDDDGLNDAEELKKKTDPFKKNIMQTDLDWILEDGVYISSISSMDYDEGTWLKIQLHVGNLLFNSKASCITNYEIALTEFVSALINVYTELDEITLIDDAVQKYIHDSYNAQHDLITDIIQQQANLLGIESGIYSVASIGNESVAYLKWLELNDEMCTCYASTLKSLDNAKTVVEKINIFSECRKANLGFIERINKLPTVKGSVVKYTDKVAKIAESIHIPSNINLSDIDDILKFSSKVISVASGVVVAVKEGNDAIQIFKGMYALDSVQLQYNKSLIFLDAVIDGTEKSTLKSAAKNIRKVVIGEKSACEQKLQTCIIDSVQGLVGSEIRVITAYMNPLACAIDLGLTLGETLWHTGQVDDAAFEMLALGDSAICLNDVVGSMIHTDTITYYYIEDEAIDYINTLAQLRIVSEDAAIDVNDSYSFLYKLLTNLIASIADLDDDVNGVCEGNKSKVQKATDKYRFISSSTEYDNILS